MDEEEACNIIKTFMTEKLEEIYKSYDIENIE